ncbi:MAG: substrate-binding domain-containing protein [Pseudomonadota bacterium]
MPALAQDVRLLSLDGTIELEGDLLSYDGAFYRVDTIYGPLTVDAEGVSCAGPGCPDLTTFVAEARLTGAATVATGLIPALLDGFATSRGLTLSTTTLPNGALRFDMVRQNGSTAARFTVTPDTTDNGFLALLNGDTDMALALREPSLVEQRAALAQAPDDPALIQRVRVIALDALVPVVAARNPADAISLPDLARFFGGEIDNWLDLGGPDAPVSRHMLSPGLGLSQGFITRLFGTDPNALSETVVFHDTAEALTAAVERDAYAIGITAQSMAGPTQALPIQGMCGFSQRASVNAVKAEDYPLTAPIYLYLAPQRLPPLVRDFLAFTETAAAEQAVAASGFVNQTLTRTPLAAQGMRLANAISAAGSEVSLPELQTVLSELATAERLSSTFRFGEGSIDLDAPSRASAARLAAAIEQGRFDGRRLIFAGFSDGNGQADVNARLSLRRADAARDAVVALAGASAPNRVEIVTRGYGEAMPLACDDSDWGRAVNRRVEVWLD